MRIITTTSLVTFVTLGLVLFASYSGINSINSSITCEPSQVRIHLGDNYSPQSDQVNHNDVTISFHTSTQCLDSNILVKQNGETLSFVKHESVHSLYKDTFCHKKKLCELVNYDQYIHHFMIKLPQQGQFSYQVNGGSGFLQSQIMTFNATIPPRTQQKGALQKFIYFGDLDNTDITTNTYKLLDKERQEDIQAYIFLGDYGYEFYQNDGQYLNSFIFILRQGDKFLQNLQPYISEKPWMMTAGNHEDNFNFTFFNDKFRMPNYIKSNNNYFSFDVGLVHFISLNFHFYRNGESKIDVQSPSAKKQMTDWLEQDLKQANQNRAAVPWIIGYGHMSLYCVSSECSDYPSWYPLFDDLFYQYGVDLFLGAHKHEYQFVKPVHREVIRGYQRPDNHTMINPEATIYVVQGNGGNKNMMQGLDRGELKDTLLLARDAEPGMGRLTVFNETQLLLEYIRSESGNVQDYQTIIKQNHLPFRN